MTGQATAKQQPAEAAAAPAAPPSRYDVHHLGLRLRHVRKARSLTIAQLAAASRVPIATISKIENGQLRPSLVHAINLATALGENLGFLVDRYRTPASNRSVVRRDRRDEIRYPDMGLSLEDVTGNFMPGLLEARIGRLRAGAQSGGEPMRHPGEELCHVLEGRVRYAVGRGRWELGPGDTIHFKAGLPHRWENAARGTSVVLWCFSDGLSF